jgi:hypothetical protein
MSAICKCHPALPEPSTPPNKPVNAMLAFTPRENFIFNETIRKGKQIFLIRTALTG